MLAFIRAKNDIFMHSVFTIESGYALLNLLLDWFIRCEKLLLSFVGPLCDDKLLCRVHCLALNSLLVPLESIVDSELLLVVDLGSLRSHSWISDFMR